MASTATIASNVIVLEALNQHNYKDWSSRVQTYLLSKDLWDIVTTEPPKPGEAEYKAWRTKNAKALHAIKISCGTEIFYLIRETTIAKTAWEDLEKASKSKATLLYEGKERDGSLHTANNAGQTREVGTESLLADEELEPSEEGNENNVKYKYDSSYYPFFKYVIRGDWNHAKECLATLHPDVVRARRPGDGCTALQLAAWEGHVHTIKELRSLMTQEDLEIKDNDGDTALHSATYKGNVDIVKELVSSMRQQGLEIKNKNGYTALHRAVGKGHGHIIKELTSLMAQEDLEIKDNDGYTALHTAVIKRNVAIVEQLVLLMRPEGLRIQSNNGETALHIATRSGQVNIVEKLVSMMGEEDLELRDVFGYTALGDTLYLDQSEGDLVQIATYMVDKNKKILCISSSRKNFIPVVEAFGLSKWELSRYLYSVTPLMALMPETGTQGAQLISTCIRLGKELDIAWDLLQRCPRLAIVDNGFGSPPMLELANVPCAFLSGKQLRFLQKWIYNRINIQPEPVDHFKLREISIDVSKFEDDQGNERDPIRSVMRLYRRFVKGHLAKLLANLSPLTRIQGASLKMQRELQWFKDVESIVPVEMHGYLNFSDGLTAHELFTKNHKKLMKEAEISMKGTASSCTTVGALIVTIMFAVAFTVPGGTNDDTGLPTFMHKKLFRVFIVADTISLVSSSTSVITFLGILTSRYAEDDFLKSLPKKMVVGISTLFISIATMMLAFFCALTIMLDEKAWIIIPSIIFASIPIISFVWLLFPLLVEICISTYGPGIFNRIVKPWYYLDVVHLHSELRDRGSELRDRLLRYFF